METLTDVGLDTHQSEKTVEQLNKLLANVQVLYMNVRGYHWNIRGPEFFMLHEKFEELYSDLAEKADEIAERILMLNGTPVHAFSRYLKTSKMKETENVSDAHDCVMDILSGLQFLIRTEREILKMASGNDDEGTAALMSDYIGSQEKLVWMYGAWLK
jgi:starvation-inducible DNA-binding protein